MSHKITLIATGVIAMFALAGCSGALTSDEDALVSESSQIAVPDVVGMQVDLAEDQLEALGFDVEVNDPVFEEAIADADLMVTEQSVSEGELLAPGSTITLTADKAPQD
ncbi:PASTA domain-containing protein [Plantibacter sp. RU18]|uniref:PASTA domain-containing protein n=1 Tax=Plantibacter sp. RU18 TaxID=3158143 RepID=UPI003D35F35A